MKAEDAAAAREERGAHRRRGVWRRAGARALVPAVSPGPETCLLSGCSVHSSGVGGAAVAPVTLGGIRVRPALPPKQVQATKIRPADQAGCTPLWRLGWGRWAVGGMTGLDPHCARGSPSHRPCGTAPQKRATPPQRVEQLRGQGQGWDVTPLCSHRPATQAREAPGNHFIQTPSHQMLTSLPFQVLGSRRRLLGQWQKGDGDPWDILAGAGCTD